MVICLFGESCVGKSTIADKLSAKICAKIYTGRDYIKLSRNETDAKRIFIDMLTDAVHGDNIIYVVSDPEHLAILPDGTVRVLVTADLDTKKARFMQRLHGTLPPPITSMLERKHGMFDDLPHDMHIDSETTDSCAACAEIIAHIRK